MVELVDATGVDELALVDVPFDELVEELSPVPYAALRMPMRLLAELLDDVVLVLPPRLEPGPSSVVTRLS